MASVTKTRPQFGQTVTVTAKAWRRNRYEVKGAFPDQYTQTFRVWERFLAFKSPRRAMYIGFRTKYNGESEWIDEVGNVFTPNEHFEMWLVVEDERHAPYFVWPDDCEVNA